MSIFSKLGKIGKVAAMFTPVGAAMTGGSKLAGLMGGGSQGKPKSKLGSLVDFGAKLGGLAGGVDTAMHGGIDAPTRGTLAAQRASQAAGNRFREASLTPGAVGADTTAFRNMMRASNVAGYTPNPRAQELWAKYGQSTITPGASAQQFAQAMRDNLQKRMAAGQALTLSGVQAPGAQEMADEKAALQASKGGGGFLGAVQTGSRLAGLIPQIGGLFGRGQQQDDDDYEQGNG